MIFFATLALVDEVKVVGHMSNITNNPIPVESGRNTGWKSEKYKWPILWTFHIFISITGRKYGHKKIGSFIWRACQECLPIVTIQLFLWHWEYQVGFYQF